VITTSLDKDEVPAAQVVRYYRSLQNVERRFRVMKDFLSLRPMFHWTEARVRGHVALCVLAATIEAVMAAFPVDDTTEGPFGVERGTGAAHLRRKQADQAREPAQCPPGQGAPGPLRQHLNLVQGPNRPTRTFSSRVGGTRLLRDPIYLGRRESRAKVWAGAKFENGVMVERADEQDTEVAAWLRQVGHP
jgi:hypothetical protein